MQTIQAEILVLWGSNSRREKNDKIDQIPYLSHCRVAAILIVRLSSFWADQAILVLYQENFDSLGLQFNLLELLQSGGGISTEY